MLITRIELENIKSYRHLALDFRRGTTAISGANGAGKTTLVEAIGFALFDFLPYSQAKFVREGEKYGRIIVHLIGNDDRPYEVERRCGSGSQWTLYDREANYRLEQRADVQDKLHELFGIDRERPLENLFSDAIGVSQGKFTTVFLEPASKRKQTFNALLQIEDYTIAADYLLEAQKQYKEQMQTQESEIQRLTFETRDLESWRGTLKAARERDQEQKLLNAQWQQALTQHEAREAQLTQEFHTLQQLEQVYAHSKTKHDTAQQRLDDRLVALNTAHTAQQAVEASSSDHQRYQEADARLQQLRTDEKQRNVLRTQQATLHNRLATVKANIEHLHTRLDEVATAYRTVAKLQPEVEKQHELDKRREVLTQQKTEHERLLKECKRLAKQHTDCLQEHALLQQRIAAIEPLQPLAILFTERVESLTRLTTRLKERGSKQKQLEEKHKQLKEKREEHGKAGERLRKVENYITKCEEHRHEAEELPLLQTQQIQLSAQLHRLEGNVEAYRDSRQQSAGGQCPLLHETCLNIKQRGLLSLESYFDKLLTEDQVRIDEISRQRQGVESRVSSAKKHAEALSKLDQYIEQRELQTELVQRQARDLQRLEDEIASLEQDLGTFERIDREIAQARAAREESEQADRQVRELESLRTQAQQLQVQAQQYVADLSERQQQADALSGSATELQAVKQELQALNDPASRSKAQQEIIKQEPLYQQKLQAEQQQQQTTTQQLQALEQQLLVYADLDAHIGKQEAIKQQSHQGYQTYLKNEQEARLLPERAQAHEQALRAANAAQQARDAAEQAYTEAQAAFDEQELKAVSETVKQLRYDLNNLAGEMTRLQGDMNKLEQDIQRAEAYLAELAAAEKEKATLEELHAMLVQFRNLLKEAAPHVLKAMLADISAEANRFFGEIMGDRSAQLSWQNDYEVVLCRQGVNRTFAQLSGGEQMSAALAVRLALLKKLSTLNIAFFDEPTQNMDELRRSNLAEQIRRVRGFDQLIVISHDDTFEQGLDSLVRLRKVDGETRWMAEEGAAMLEGEPTQAYVA